MLSIRALILGLAPALGLGLVAVDATAQPTPSCTPARLNGSALEDGTVALSPLPGSRDASPATQISFRGVAPSSLRVLSVVGSRTGAHAGALRPYSQGDGASFVPQRPFREGETVTVRAQLLAGAAAQPLLDRFQVASVEELSSTPERSYAGSASQVQGFLSRPDLRPPAVTVTAQSPAAATGDIFLAPYSGPGQAGPMILDEHGGLVWFQPLPHNVSATNFRVQQLEGKPVLTWWQGDVSEHGFGIGADVVLDAGYRRLAVIKGGNGRAPDLHEFQLTPNATALITSYAPIRCNLSALGGPSEGNVTDGVLQEVDVRTGLVRFEWTSLDHVAMSDSYESARHSKTNWPFDYFHINSIGLDDDGSLLVSARNTWTVYELEGASGQVAWRLGGRHSSFAAGPGTRTAWQHDPREQPDGTLSIFDNGASPPIRRESRGVVLSVDRQHMTATLVAQFTHTPPLLAESQGNMQALPNGDWFIGWGQAPALSEYGPEGQLVFDAKLPAHAQSYRSFRFAWTGTPPGAPTFALQELAGQPATVHASWNGATLIASWRVLSGPSPTAMQAVTQVASSGFETAIALPSQTQGPYLGVEALDAHGGTLGVSAAAFEPALAAAPTP